MEKIIWDQERIAKMRPDSVVRTFSQEEYEAVCKEAEELAESDWEGMRPQVLELWKTRYRNAFTGLSENARKFTFLLSPEFRRKFMTDYCKSGQYDISNVLGKNF